MQTAQAPSSQTIQEIVSDSIGAFLNGIGDFLPNILAALLILFVGWIIARVFKAGVGRVLRTIKFPMLAERAGIDGFLKTGGVKQTSTELLAVLVYWLIMLIVLVTAVNALRLEMASQLLNQIMLYIPNIIVAVIVLVVGLYAANFVAGLVRTAAANAGIAEAEIVALIEKGFSYQPSAIRYPPSFFLNLSFMYQFTTSREPNPTASAPAKHAAPKRIRKPLATMSSPILSWFNAIAKVKMINA